MLEWRCCYDSIPKVADLGKETDTEQTEGTENPPLLMSIPPSLSPSLPPCDALFLFLSDALLLDALVLSFLPSARKQCSVFLLMREEESDEMVEGMRLLQILLPDLLTLLTPTWQ